MSRLLRSDRPSLSVGLYVVTNPQRVGRYVATDPQRVGRYVATDPQRVGRYVATNPQLVGRYVATDPQSSRSLRSDRPSHSFGRYVATDPSRTRSLRSDQTISDIDQRVSPNPCTLVCSSMLAPMYRSHIISHSHRLELSFKLYDKNRGKFILIDKIVINVSNRKTAQVGLRRD
ncbi:hypothetical protein DY000_02039824 [Brassica cretica]|uniref:Uncharacterized protein n=1 Tax=Brassica cretica TaxID=69181 RepID=A0ABQ7BIZ0_BRACR|nr:hypothetical protein DY000_02039824 [Brassica cretica]